MKKLSILLIILTLFVIFGCSKTNNEIRPEVVLIELSIWNTPIGSEGPSFVLYNDGTAIFLTNNNYMSVKLTETEKNKIIDELNLSRIFKLRNRYVLEGGTDYPATNIYVWQKNRHKKVSIYGICCYSKMKSMPVMEYVPKDFTDIFMKLSTYENTNATEWIPDKIEVIIWPYENAPEKSVLWPKEWPDINSCDTKKRGKQAWNEDSDVSYSLYLPKSELSKFELFLQKMKRKQAVEINGKKWSISYRFPFPAEDKWPYKISDIECR